MAGDVVPPVRVEATLIPWASLHAGVVGEVLHLQHTAGGAREASRQLDVVGGKLRVACVGVGPAPGEDVPVGLVVVGPEQWAGIEAALVEVCLPVTEPEGQATSVVDL